MDILLCRNDNKVRYCWNDSLEIPKQQQPSEECNLKAMVIFIFITMVSTL